VYIPAVSAPFWYTNAEKFAARPNAWNLAIDIDAVVAQNETAAPKLSGHLLAWDPVAQKAVWRVEHAGHVNSGVLATAGGLVFQGTGDGAFRAYDDATGTPLWEARSQTGIVAAPISYALGGEQYVAVAAGYGGGVIADGLDETTAIAKWHNEGRVLVWKLGGTLPMPENQKRDRTIPPPPALEITDAQVAQGKSLYHRDCTYCHGFFAASSFLVPDLRMMSAERHAAFADIVLRGALRGNGMPGFEGMLTEQDLVPLRAYIVSEARKAYEKQQAPKN
jgi:mono/diheme cytochrome c family protein